MSSHSKRDHTPTNQGGKPVGLPSLLANPNLAQGLPSARELSRVLSEVEREEPTNLHPVEFDDGTSQFPAAAEPTVASALVPDATVKKYTVPEPQVLPENDEPTQPSARPGAMRSPVSTRAIRLEEAPANDISLQDASIAVKVAAWTYRVLIDLTVKLRKYLERRGAI